MSWSQRGFDGLRGPESSARATGWRPSRALRARRGGAGRGAPALVVSRADVVCARWRTNSADVRHRSGAP
eukprot:1520133-Pyramimonas_sp.AAC.1